MRLLVLFGRPHWRARKPSAARVQERRRVQQVHRTRDGLLHDSHASFRRVRRSQRRVSAAAPFAVFFRRSSEQRLHSAQLGVHRTGAVVHPARAQCQQGKELILETHQGVYILAAIREKGCGLPVLISYDFSAEPKRWRHLESRYSPLQYLSDNVGPDQIRAALKALLPSPLERP